MNDKSDLTRIEDLAEFLHQEDSTNTNTDVATNTIHGTPPIPEDAAQEFSDNQNLEEKSEEFTPPALEQEVELPPSEDLPSWNDSPTAAVASWETPSEPSSPVLDITPPNESTFDTIEKPLASETPSKSPIESTFNTERVQTNFPPDQSTTNFKTEKFEDVRTFSENLSYGAIVQGGNPPYSVMLKNIVEKEDGATILEILNEHGFLNDGNRKDFEQGIENGAVLIPHINEYSAIYLAHRFRNLNLDIKLGLAEEIHPSKSYPAEKRTPISHRQIFRNRHTSFDLEKDNTIDINDILLATTDKLPNHQINKYLGIISEHIIITENELNDFQADEEMDTPNFPVPGTLPSSNQTLEHIYKKLAERLRERAHQLKANAIIGISYNLIPLHDQHEGVNYKISVLGNAVWATQNE